MKICTDIHLLLWIIGLCICMTMSYNIPDKDLVLTDDTVSSVDNEDRSDIVNVDESVRLAARKPTFQTDHRSLSLNSPEHGSVLWKSPKTYNDKPDARKLLSDKRAYMHDPFETITKQLDANTDTLETLTEDIGMMKSEIISKLGEFKTISEAQKANANTLSTLTDNVKNINTKLILIDDEIGANSEVQNVNTQTCSTIENSIISLSGDVAMMKSQLADLKLLPDKINNMNDKFQAILELQKANDEMLDNLKKYIKMRMPLYPSCIAYREAGYSKSGEYKIYIPSTETVFTVYCDQNTDGGGWLVFQRRENGSIDFYRGWNDYKSGFGNVNGEFWLGNDHLHSLTRDQQELRVDLVDFDGNTAYAKYSSFSVGSESENYKLSVSGFSGTAGDPLTYMHNGQEFSTKDRDNDVSYSSCAQTWKGAWWYRNCHYANLNGIYYHSAKIDHGTGVNWYNWKRKYESLKKSEMKIRPKQ